jgi:UDP:flavonoid glycosyltransferase YjiC (YdhE family)
MSKSLRILVLGTSAGGGDWPPLVAAALSLAKAGHEIAYLGDEGLARATAGNGLTIETVSPGRDLPARMRDWAVARLENPATPIPILDWVDDVAQHAVERAKSLAPDLLLCSDFTALLGIRVREEIRTPMCLINATYYLGPGSRRRLEEDFAPGATEAQGFAQLLQSGDLVLHATDAQFDPPPEPCPANHHWIGTLIWEPVGEPPAWLADHGDPWALVTLSSSRQENEMELARAAIGALAGFPLRALVTLADPRPHEELGDQAANVRVETFVPHSPVLERAALCVAHAGHGIVAKALQFGVPMVLVPWDRDQPGVAARAEALGVARVVARDALTPETLAAAIREVLESPDYAKRARYHRDRIRADSPPSDKMCDLVTAFMAERALSNPG